MTRIALVLAAGLLALPSAAAAKGIERVELCGAGGCKDVTRDASNEVTGGGAFTAGPEWPEPSFVLRIAIGDGTQTIDTWETVWLPRSERLRGPDGRWAEVPPRTQRELVRLSKGLEPRPVRARVEDARGPNAMAIAAPAAGLLGLAAVAVRRRRRRA